MQVDLEAGGASVEGLPRFQQGLFHARRLRQAGISLMVLGVAGWVLALFVALFVPLSIWPVVLINCASALLLLVAGLQSAWWVADWRAQSLEEPAVDVPVEGSGRYARFMGRVGKQVGAPALWLGGWSLLVLVSVIEFWNLALPAAPVGQSASIGAALGLALAFGLLVFERRLAQESTAQWPEASPLAQLSRLAIICLVVSAVCLLFAGAASVWPLRVAVLVGLLPALASLEFLLRAVLSLFSPRQPRLEPRLMAQSFIAGLLR